MKTVVKGAIRDEKGNVLILVLILLVVGGLILTPLLGLMSTGLLAGQVYERKMQEYYAADAGIEDALWKITHDEIPSDVYNLTVNDMSVLVEIETINAESFLEELLDYKVTKEPHSDWVSVYQPTHEGLFTIEITYVGNATKKHMDCAGAWFSGTYSYVQEQIPPEGDIRNDDTNYTFEERSYQGGTAFIWTWKGSGPEFSKNETKILAFEYEPDDRFPSQSITWAIAGSHDIGLSGDADFALYMITAIAISDTGAATADIDSQTTVVASVVPRRCPVNEDEIEVLNWNIS